MEEGTNHLSQVQYWGEVDDYCKNELRAPTTHPAVKADVLTLKANGKQGGSRPPESPGLTHTLPPSQLPPEGLLCGDMLFREVPTGSVPSPVFGPAGVADT